jgi:hypothetical protein
VASLGTASNSYKFSAVPGLPRTLAAERAEENW